MDNDSATSDLKSPVFDMESERFELDTNAAGSRSSCVDLSCMNDIFNSDGSDVSEDESPEFHHDDQGIDTTELNYSTMTCVIDVKGIVKSCVPTEHHKLSREKIELLHDDIKTIENRLISFSDNHIYFYDFDTRDQILLTIDLIKKDISRLDDYWNGHYLVIEELNRQINELNHSNTGLCHMNQEVADLYSIYANTKFIMRCMITYRKNELVSLDKAEDFLTKLQNWTPPNGPNSESVTSYSESVTSDSESVTSDSSSDRRSEFSIDDDNSDDYESLFIFVDAVKQFLMMLINWTPSNGPNSERDTSDSESVTSDSGSDRRSEFSIDDDNSDDYESLFIFVNADVAAEETIVETHPLNNNACFRLMKWIANPYCLIVMIVMILWLAGWLGPQ